MTIQEINEEIKKLQELKEEIKVFAPTVCNIGYLGEDYNKNTDKGLYTRWVNLINRCYNPNSNNYKTYGEKGITVDKEWLNFSNFKKWFNENYYDIGEEKLVVDKDVLIKNNKVYSSKTCLLLPISFNSMFAGMNEYSGKKNKCSAGIRKENNNKYTLQIFGTTFSNFSTLENAIDTRKRIYKDLFVGMVKNYPTMPQKIKDAILNAEL